SLGFRIKPKTAGPQPGMNDIIWLIIILLLTLSLPLLLVTRWHTIDISIMVILAVLVPVLLAIPYPQLLIRHGNYTAPPIIFPFIVTMLVGLFTFILSSSQKILVEVFRP